MPNISTNPKLEAQNSNISNFEFLISNFFAVFLISYFGFISPCSVSANTDPQSATASATATIPSFIVTDDTEAPTTPILISPSDETITNSAKPEFVWYQSSDPNGNTLYYTLHLNNVATYLGISNLGNSSGFGYTARLDYNQIKLNTTTSFPDGDYVWYVTATDLSGNSRRSTSWRLTIDTSAPLLTLTHLDTLDSPSISEGANFELVGPKDVYFTLLTDPQIQVQLNLQGPSSHSLVTRSDKSGLAYFSPALAEGTYFVTIFATDAAGNTTFLPDFSLTLTPILLPIPGVSPLPLPPILYNFPSTLTHLPSTISQISPTISPALLYSLLLAILWLVVLIILSKRHYNLTLLNTSLVPITNATIYHSHGSKLGFFTLAPSARGRIFIPHLTRNSSLTIRIANQHDCTTHVLSLSRSAHRYTLVL